MFRFGHTLYNNAYGGGAPVVDNDFVIRVKTDNAGTSASNQFTLPTTTGTYDYTIDWGDGTVENITTSASQTHTYASVGEYTIRISGTFPRIYFNFGGDRLKLVETLNFGNVGWVTFENSFYGCSNNVINSTSTGVFPVGASYRNAWRNNTSITSFPALDLSGGISFGGSSTSGAWAGCTSMTSFNTTLLGSGYFQGAWANCTSLISFPLADTSQGTNFFEAWWNCSSLTSFPVLDFSNSTGFYRAWRGCTGITDFPALDLNNASGFLDFREAWLGMGVLNSFATRLFYGMTNGLNCFNHTTLPTADYSDILVTQNANNPNNSVTFHGGNSKYDSSALSARTNLVSVKSWSITDGGLV